MALEGLLSCMNSQMSVEIVLLVERLSTDGASVRLLSCVSSLKMETISQDQGLKHSETYDVCLQVIALDELLSAVCTFVRLIVSVNSPKKQTTEMG